MVKISHKLPILCLFLLAVLTLSPIVSAKQLTLKAAYVLDGVDGLEPSGLAICDGKLLFVSDKHEQFIYQLKMHKSTAKVIPFHPLTNIPSPPPQKYPLDMKVKRTALSAMNKAGMDWEGLACHENGTYYLASEYNFSVLAVNDQAKEWVVDNLYHQGYQKGLFKVQNAFIEAITLSPKGNIILAAERQPRAILTIPPKGTVKIHLDTREANANPQISYDYTGMDHYNGDLYVLDRNRYQVCQRNPPMYQARRCYTFKDHEHSETWGYDTGIYGLAEGLAMDDENLWVIFDNNKDPRLADPQDKRPTIMQFENPYSTHKKR